MGVHTSVDFEVEGSTTNADIFKGSNASNEGEKVKTAGSNSDNGDSMETDNAREEDSGVDIHVVDKHKTVDEPRKELKPLPCLWVSGVSSNMKAISLKYHFSQFGVVNMVKVVKTYPPANTASPAKPAMSECFAFVAMPTLADAEKCVEKLHNTYFRNQLLLVEQMDSEE